MHVWQYLTLTTTPFTTTSLVGGKLGGPLCAPSQSADKFEASPSYSGSGGCELRGIMPGSLLDVRKRTTTICKVKKFKPTIKENSEWKQKLGTHRVNMYDI